MVDWGPKPFRVLDWWLKNKEYQTLVKESWTGDQQAGWGGFVLKKKLRNLKSSLKQWSREFGDVKFKKFQQLRQQLNDIDNIACDRSLTAAAYMEKMDQCLFTICHYINPNKWQPHKGVCSH